MTNKLEQQKNIAEHFKLDISTENFKDYENALADVEYDERVDDDEKDQATFIKTLKFGTSKKLIIPYSATPVKVELNSKEGSEKENFFQTESKTKKTGNTDGLSLVPSIRLSEDASTVTLKLHEQEEKIAKGSKENRLDLLETIVTVPKGTEVYRETADGKLEKVTLEK